MEDRNHLPRKKFKTHIMVGDVLVEDFMSYVAQIGDILCGDFMSGDFLTWIHELVTLTTIIFKRIENQYHWICNIFFEFRGDHRKSHKRFISQ